MALSKKTKQSPTLRLTPLTQFGYVDPLGKIQRGEKVTTLRKTRKRGIYELADGGSRFKPHRTGVFIEFYQSDKVDPRDLTDEQWQADGIDAPRSQNGLALLTHFYGTGPSEMFLNHFRLVKGQ